MIKNIASKYSIMQFVNLFKKQFNNKFNFVYLVMDSKTDCNQGYGFINMIKGPIKYSFFKKFNNKTWPNSKSGKKCEITYARFQKLEKIDKTFIYKYFREYNKYLSLIHI